MKAEKKHYNELNEYYKEIRECLLCNLDCSSFKI